MHTIEVYLFKILRGAKGLADCMCFNQFNFLLGLTKLIIRNVIYDFCSANKSFTMSVHIKCDRKSHSIPLTRDYITLNFINFQG